MLKSRKLYFTKNRVDANLMQIKKEMRRNIEERFFAPFFVNENMFEAIEK